MGILISVATAIFAILCVLLVILILLQSDKSAGMGILGGSSQSAFGSSTADVITKITAYFVGFFMLLSLGLASMESVRARALEKEIEALTLTDEEIRARENPVQVQDGTGFEIDLQPVESTEN